METSWRIMPVERARLRPMKSMRKKAHMREEMSLTRPKMAVAKSFSFWPVVPLKAISGVYKGFGGAAYIMAKY